MPVFYLETSALVKKYRTEKGTEVIAGLFQGKREAEVFVTSYFTVLEITSVATRLLRAGTLRTRTYEVILGRLSQDVRGTIRLQSVSDSVLSEATRLTQVYALRAPDAIHMATALSVRATTHDEPFYFLGSDARLNTGCENSGLVVLDPEDTDSLNTLRTYRSGE